MATKIIYPHLVAAHQSSTTTGAAALSTILLNANTHTTSSSTTSLSSSSSPSSSTSSSSLSSTLTTSIKMPINIERDAGFCSGSSENGDDFVRDGGPCSPTDSSEDSIEVKLTPIMIPKNKRKSLEPSKVICETDFPLKKRIKYEDKMGITAVQQQSHTIFDDTSSNITNSMFPKQIKQELIIDGGGNPFRPWALADVEHASMSPTSSTIFSSPSPPSSQHQHQQQHHHQQQLQQPQYQHHQQQQAQQQKPSLPNPAELYIRHPAVTTLHRAVSPQQLLISSATNMISHSQQFLNSSSGSNNSSGGSDSDYYQDQPLALIKKPVFVEPKKRPKVASSIIRKLSETPSPPPPPQSSQILHQQLPIRLESPDNSSSYIASNHKNIIESSELSHQHIEQQDHHHDHHHRQLQQEEIFSAAKSILLKKSTEQLSEIDGCGSSSGSQKSSSSLINHQDSNHSNLHHHHHHHRNYKNMTRERRIEANARERTRVHTISAAFETLRNSVPSYANTQKLSKLSTLRVACSYILTLSRMVGDDYSLDQSEPTVNECTDEVTRTIQTEGKIRKKKDE